MRQPQSAQENVGALVIGGDYRGLGIVRSLGRHSIPVWVLADEHRIATVSRYAVRSLRWPERDEKQQLEFLLGLADQHRLDGWAVFPTGDEAAALLARQHQVLSSRYVLTTPDWEHLRWAYDKRLAYRLAQNLGLDCPETHFPADSRHLATLPISFPAILKPAIKPELNRFTRSKAWLVRDRVELTARYEAACQLVPAETVMVQELIEGGGEAQFSYAGLFRDGQPLASIVARRSRQFPVDFGRSSSFVESIEQPDVEQAGQRLLAAARFTGLAEVEFKRDPGSGHLKLLDVNPRAWGWHSLGRQVGLDFAWLEWQLARGLPVARARAPVGLKWLHLITDLQAAYSEHRCGRLSPAGYLRSLAQPLELAILASDDPLPSLAEVPLLGFVAWQRLWAAARPSLALARP
jgi:predicted ATP-grasp superfamily ATP-dependent carboligase